jgi:hypothetical protein
MMLTLRSIQFCHTNNRRLVQFWQNFQTSLVLLIPNCTRHRMITYTNIIEDFFIIFLILLVCGTPRKFVTTKLSIRKPGYRSSSVLIIY